MPDEVKIPVRTPGAAQAKQALSGVAAAEQKVGQAGRRAGKEASQGSRQAKEALQEQGGAVDGLMGKVENLVKAYLGLAAARKILSELAAETQRITETSITAAESLTAILALSNLERSRPEVQEAVKSMAVMAGRPLPQVAQAYYTLLGGTAGMGYERQMGLLQQSLLMAKTDPNASLNALVGLFSTIATQQPELTPLQIGNALSRTIEQAKSTPEEMAQYLPSILTTGRAAGVDMATSLGMFSFGTRRGGGVAESGTAIRAAILGLLAPSPDTAKQLGEFGFPLQGDLRSRMDWLRRAGGGLPPELIAALGGRRGLEAIAGMAEAPVLLQQEIGGMQRALVTPENLLEQRLFEMYGQVPAQALLQGLQQTKEALKRKDDDIRALAVELSEKQLDLALRDYPFPLRLLAKGITRFGRTTGLISLSEEEARAVAESTAEQLRAGRPINFYGAQVGGTSYHGTYKDPAGRIVQRMSE